MVKGIFQPMECHAQYVNWGELAGSHRSLLKEGLGIGLWMVSNCVVHHLVFLGFIPLFSFPLLLIISFIFCFSSITKLFLSQSNPRGLLFNSPPRQGQGKGKQGAVWGLVANWG